MPDISQSNIHTMFDTFNSVLTYYELPLKESIPYSSNANSMIGKIYNIIKLINELAN